MITQLEEIRQRHSDEAAIQDHLDQEEWKYQEGLKDGMNGVLRGSLFESVSYMSGYNEGMQRRQCGVRSEEEWQKRRSQEGWLERGWGDELLNPLDDEF